MKTGEIKKPQNILTLPAYKRTTLGMAKRFLTVDEVVALMEKQRGDKTLREYAAELGVTNQFLCDIFKRRRNPGETVLAKMGLTQRVVYEKTA